MSFAGNWTEHELMMLSKISQTQKDSVTCFLSYMETKEKKIKVEGRLFGKKKEMREK
jgi:hypothetical protein